MIPVLLGLFQLQSALSDTDPWTSRETLQPDAAVKALNTPVGKTPVVFHVGFHTLFQNGHIPGSKYVGAGSTLEGINKLRAELKNLPRDREIIVYCGCCPLVNCPNLKPVFRVIKEMGFKNAKVILIQDNFKKDWIEKGFPVEKGKALSE